MFIDWHTITHLPVYTESGQKLGSVREIEIDIETHSIRKYIVTHGFFTGKETFLITPLQVKSITAEKMVVEDTIIKASKPGGIATVAPDQALGGVTS